MVQVSGSVQVPRVTALGERLVSHAGAGLLCEVADLSGLTAGLSGLFARHGYQWRSHAPGVVLARVAAGIADGMSSISGVAAFGGSRPGLFAGPASTSTVRRTVFSFGDELMPVGLDAVLAAARGRAWAAAGFDPAGLNLDADATLLVCHSEKELAAATFKASFGLHPLGFWIDETHEPLAMISRPGNAGSNTAIDHIEVLERSINQLPEAFRQGHQHGDSAELVLRYLRIRADGAGATKAFLAECRARNITFSVGFKVDAAVRALIETVPDQAWVPAVDADDGTIRAGAQVVELAGPGPGWPTGSRLICRRENPHPGAQLSLFDHLAGQRHTAFLTDADGADIAVLELAHRRHARVEDRIRTWKEVGATHLPFWDHPANEAWLNLSLIAMTLIAWSQLVGFAGKLAKAEPRTFRTLILHIAAQTATRARRHYLNLDRHWPHAKTLAAAWHHIREAFKHAAPKRT